jgi:glycosyltransferase involved in cell wall biosynthesis
MKIIYFTTACEKEDYISFSKNWNTSLNTSIQNLHNRLIRSLALTHEVEVISIRPFSKKYCKLRGLPSALTNEGKITWHYLEIKRHKVARFLSAKRQAKKLLSKMNLKDCIILTDTLNPYILNSSTSLAKKYNLPIIGICNNTPSGIHNTGKSYTQFLLSMADDLSGYIAMTSGLNDLYNERSRASLILEGVNESKYKEFDTKKYGKYIFYNGSLEEKYGVYDLIKAFNELNREDLKLVITGYHNFEESKFSSAIMGNPNIIHLGMLDADKILSLENGALMNVNPCPYTEDFDRYLIPVNMLDYLASNTITVSVKNNKLQKYFDEDCIWVNSSDEEDLVNGMKKALEMKREEKNKITKKAVIDMNKTYSMPIVNKKIILFLKQFLKQKD